MLTKRKKYNGLFHKFFLAFVQHFCFVFQLFRISRQHRNLTNQVKKVEQEILSIKMRTAALEKRYMKARASVGNNAAHSTFGHDNMP